MTYRVHVTREGDQWLADVPELEGASTYASNLNALDRYVREVIVLAADLPDSAMDDLELDWSYDISNQLVQQANELRAERAALAAKERQLEQATAFLAAKLTEDLGFSARDAGPLLGISHQRVSQLTPRQRPAAQVAAAAAAAAAAKAPTKKTAKKVVAKRSVVKNLAPGKAAGSWKAVPTKAVPRKTPRGEEVAPVAAKADRQSRKAK